MNRRIKQAFARKMARHGFQPWQVAAAQDWDGFRRRNWRRVAHRVFGVKP